MQKRTIVIASPKVWTLNCYNLWNPPDGFSKHMVTSPELLTPEYLGDLDPIFIFFPHWSWKISPEIFTRFECIAFHMTDVPFGRGGSPLQNLIVRGIYKTKITALQMVEAFDAGPIYLKKDFDINTSSAQFLYEQASRIIFTMIDEIIEKRPNPIAQQGAITIFRRRKPEESKILSDLTDRQLYDFIRMLDAEGYPRAFVENGEYKIEFKNASLTKIGVVAEALFIKKDERQSKK